MENITFQDLTPAQQTASSIISLALSLIMIAALWIIFTKAGEKGWKSIIPIYSTYILFKIVYGSGWRFLLLLIPIVNIIIAIMYDFDMAKSFGKGAGFGLGLLFLSPIFLLILAFGSAEYVGTKNDLRYGEGRIVS